MSGRPRLRAVLVVALLAAAGPAAAELPELLPVPEPVLGNLEPPIQRQVREHRAELERLLADPATGPELLGAAFARMGQLYFVYDLGGAAEACLTNAAALLPGDFRWHHYLGTLHGTEGDLEKARDRLERAIELEPAYLPAYVRLGRALFDLGRLDEAEAAFRRALELDPDSAAAHHGLGRVLFDRKEYAAAAAEFERVLELDPEAVSAHHPLGMAYRQLGDMEKARHHLAQTPSEIVPVHLTDPIVEGLSTLIVGAQIHFKKGLEAARAGDLEKAAAGFRTAIEIDPRDPLSHYNLGLTLLKSQAADQEVIDAFAKAVELDPDYRDARYVLASVLAKAGRADEAAFHYGEAYRIDPQDQEAHLMWALALSKAGDDARALAELERIVEAEPKNAAALLNLGTLLAQAGRVDEAMAAYQRITALEGVEELVDARLRLGDLLRERGRDAAATDHYRAALELAPDRADAYLGLARTLGRRGAFAEAAAQFEKVIELRPDDAEAHFARGLAWILAGDTRRARQALEESRRTLPDVLPVTHLLARLLATSPEAEVRDGARAVDLAFRVFSRAQSLDHAETVAMALAEAGRFEEAVRWQSRVVEELERAGGPGAGEAARERLDRYRAGQAVRSPWQQAGAPAAGSSGPGGPGDRGAGGGAA